LVVFIGRILLPPVHRPATLDTSGYFFFGAGRAPGTDALGEGLELGTAVRAALDERAIA
jgi:hypothetical protein